MRLRPFLAAFAALLAAALCLGHNVTKAWDLDAEVYFTTSASLGRSETILNVGTRYDFSEHATLLLAADGDAHNSPGPRTSLLTFVGIQVSL
jgi:hypothetical protein